MSYGVNILEQQRQCGIYYRAHSLWGEVYCGPVLRHSAGLIQAANFRSAVAL
jgi:hypothetical protein